MQTDNKSYIIGGGISGLVWKFYHPEFQIISPDIGGMYARTYMVWLHRTAETIKLLEDLKLPVIAKKSYMGYSSDGIIYDYQTEWLNKKIIQRKMTPWNEPIDTTYEPKTRDLSLSTVGESNFMDTLDVDLEEVIRRLNVNANVEQGFVSSITPSHIYVKKNLADTHVDVRKYENLVSTMAAPFFWKAYGEPKDFRCSPITNIIVSKKPEMFDNEYEMVYYYDQPFSRISHLKGKWALEFTGEITKEQFIELYPDLPIVDYFVIKQGRVWESENIEPQNNIVFSGRFAQWKHKIVTEHVVSQAINYKINVTQ